MPVRIPLTRIPAHAPEPSIGFNRQISSTRLCSRLSTSGGLADWLRNKSGQVSRLTQFFEKSLQPSRLALVFQLRRLGGRYIARGVTDLPPLWWTRVTAYAAAASCSFCMGVM